MKKVLMIAYHYPPVRVSSGLQRTLSFSRFLRSDGWQPLILCPHPRAYVEVEDGQMKDIPKDVPVVRSFALDTARHLSVAGRYFDWMALPDRWSSWLIGGLWSGFRMIKKYQPSVIWSTYPIATAHLIGLALHRLTGLPWIADFRDSMTEDGYPREARRRGVYRWIERQTISYCSKAIFTTPSAIKMYRKRYPDEPETKWVLLPNGYDEQIFDEVELDDIERPNDKEISGIVDGNRITLVHSGIIYPSERDPKPFFYALRNLKQKGSISSQTVRVVLRATGHNELYQSILEELDIQDIVHLEPGIPYRRALREMMNVDGLIVLQASSCNHQIPAKIYEYFRARRPIFALTDPTGDTAATLEWAGLEDIVPLDDERAIQEGFFKFLSKLRDGTARVATEDAVVSSSRRSGSRHLADLLNTVSTPEGE